MSIRRHIKKLLGHYKGVEFDPVNPDDFVFREGSVPSWMLIMDAVEKIGGSQWEGVAYKRRILEAAGWNYRLHGELFGAEPALAAMTLNRIRVALAQTTDPVAIFDHI